jgi:hypothetical protein
MEAIMGIWLEGWAGDHAGQVDGRQPNRLLVAVTQTDLDFIDGFFDHEDEIFGGVPWYLNIHVSCLTPSSRFAIAVGIHDIGERLYSIEVAEVDFGNATDSPWKSGVHLFSLHLYSHNYWGDASTITTVIVDDKVKRIDTQNLGGPPKWWWQHFKKFGIGSGFKPRPKPS